MTQSGPVFFWMHYEEPYGPLCQWYAADVTDTDGRIFATAEHFMMYHKALTFGDQEAAEAITRSTDPEEAKKLGRQVKAYDDAVWSQKRWDVVYQGNFLKFQQHPELRTLLTQTQNRRIVEASPYDRIWGVGFPAETALQHQEEWGQNLLGQVMEAVRKALTSTA
ncbi:hypothetical protein MMC07_009745 [Pseudocyphellaria aurata]|nr:hypothetical protein [Pseudocyphellaria aurata]